MNWIQETFLQPTMIQTVAVICIVCAIGVYLGKLKYKGVSLGITFVFLPESWSVILEWLSIAIC